MNDIIEINHNTNATCPKCERKCTADLSGFKSSEGVFKVNGDYDVQFSCPEHLGFTVKAGAI
jgi:hypothetical protein